MDSLGRLNVDEFLQVKDLPDVYAIGDCNDTPEIKLAHGAEVQGKYVAGMLKDKHEGKALTPYNVNSKLNFTSHLLSNHYITRYNVNSIFICIISLVNSRFVFILKALAQSSIQRIV